MKKRLNFMRCFLTGIMVITLAQLEAQTIETDRPDQTESSSTLGRANLQIETGLLISFEGEGQGAIRQLVVPTTLFRYGITEDVEFRVVSQFENFKSPYQNLEGMSDIEIGAKFQIFSREDSSTEIAFLSHIVLPTGTEGFTNDKLGTVNKLLLSHELSDNIGLGYNVGYSFLGKEREYITYSIALGVGINDEVGIYIEPYGEIVEMEKLHASFDMGLTYLINDNLQLDFSFGTGINYKMNYLSVGFSWLAKPGKNEKS